MYKIIMAIGLLSFSFCGFAQDAAVALDKQLSQTHAFQADFVQSTRSEQFGNQLTEGEMTLERPGKFIWKITAPDKQTLVSDGKTLWVYDVDLKQVIIQPVSQRLDETPALLLAGKVESIKQFFTVTRLATDEPGQWYTLKSRDQEGLVDKVVLGFINNTIKEMKIYDNLGQRTDIRFSNIKTNPKLAQNHFKFIPPKGVEVISE